MNTTLTFDIVVVGGGPSGVAAATAAARTGAKVLLVEMTGSLGGMAAGGLVPALCGFAAGNHLIHHGIALELLNKIRAFMEEPQLSAEDDLDKVTQVIRSKGIHFLIEPEAVKYAAGQMVRNAGVEVWYFSTLCGVELSSHSQVGAVLIANRNGIFTIQAKYWIDCTGNADLCTFAGSESIKGDQNGELQPISLCMVMTGIEREWLTGEIWDKIIADKDFPLIKDNFFCPFQVGSVFRCNGGHLWGVDGSDNMSVSRAMSDGRELAKELQDALRKYVPENLQAKIVQTAELLGVRETRRIVGDYQLTQDDYRTRRRFADEIALNSYYLDLHPNSAQRQMEQNGSYRWEDSYELYGENEYHGIPYRCLTPLGLQNVIVAGRAISSDRVANAAVRVMANCLSMGQVAGTAAALCRREKISDFHHLDIQLLRNSLQQDGVFLP